MILKIILLITPILILNINAQTGKWYTFNTDNSPLPVNSIHSITIDNNDVKWISAWGGGLIKYDGINWIVFDITNSPIPHNNIYELVIDKNNNKWIATFGGGVAVLDDNKPYCGEESWTVYNTSNSELPDDDILKTDCI